MLTLIDALRVVLLNLLRFEYVTVVTRILETLETVVTSTEPFEKACCKIRNVTQRNAILRNIRNAMYAIYVIYAI